MARNEDLDLGCPIGVPQIPIIDLRSLCQDEICTIAQLSGGLPQERMNDIVNFAINRSLFNESSGSRRQTYAKHKITRRAGEPLNHVVPVKAGIAGIPLASDKHSVLVAQSKKCFELGDPKEKRFQRENLELITRICQQMKRVANVHPVSAEQTLHMKSNPLSAFLERRDACSSARDLAEQAPNSESLMQKSPGTRVESGMGLTKGNGSIHARSVDGRLENSHKMSGAKGLQLHLPVQGAGNVRVEGLDIGLKKLEVNGYGKSSYHQECTMRDFSKDEQSLNHAEVRKEANTLNEDILHRPSKKMRTKEGARRRSTMGEAEVALVALKRFQFPVNEINKGSPFHVVKKAEPRKDIKAGAKAQLLRKDRGKVDAKGTEGFPGPGGQKVSVAFRKEGDCSSTEFMNHVSPNGQDSSSHKEASAYVGSSHGLKVSVKEIAKESSEIAVASHIPWQNGFETQRPETLECALQTRNSKFKLRADQNGLRKIQFPICITCGKQFANRYSLRRHGKRKGHNVERNCDAHVQGSSSRSLMIENDVRNPGDASVNGDENVNIEDHKVLHEGIQSSSVNLNADNSSLKGECVCRLHGDSLKVRGGVGESSPYIEGLEAGEKNDLSRCMGDEPCTCQQERAVEIMGNTHSKAQKVKLECDNCHGVIETQRRSCKSKFRRVACRHCLKVFDRHKGYTAHLSLHTGKLKKNCSDSRKSGETGRTAYAGNYAPELTSAKSRPSDEPGKSSGAAEEVNRSAAGVTFADQKVLDSNLLGGMFPCDKCGKVFDNQRKFLGHKMVHLKKLKRKRCRMKMISKQTGSVADGSCQRGHDANVSALVCVGYGKAVKEQKRFTSFLSEHTRKKKGASIGPSGASITEGKGISTCFLNDTSHSTALDTVVNKREEINSSVFGRLLTYSSQSRVVEVFSAEYSKTTGLAQSEQVKDAKDFPSVPQSVTVASTPAVLGNSTGVSQKKFGLKRGRKPLSQSRQGMALLGWSLEGCFICKCVGGDVVQLVVCNWCEKEFHSYCLMQKFPVTSGGWACPFCKTTLKIPQK